MSIKKLEIDAIRADIAQIDELLRSGSEEDDPIGYRQFLTRKEQLNTELAVLEKEQRQNAAVALFFGGKPVYGSRGVLADFAAKAVAAFQEAVSKRLAASEIGSLGRRGPVPLRPSSDLMITDLARGSVGIVLEEATKQNSLTDTSLKVAIDQVVDVLADVGAEEERTFEAAAESLDDRQLMALRNLFATLDEYGATVRFVEESKERLLDEASISRGRIRTEAMQIEERETTKIVGKLLGLIPEHRRFELEIQDTGEIIYGAVSLEYSKTHRDLLGKVEGKVWRTKMRVREIKRHNRAPKFTYTLLGLLKEVK